MVRVNLSRQSFEEVEVTQPQIGVTRQNAEVIASSGEANAERVNLTRMSYELIFETPDITSVTRQGTEVMAGSGEPNAERVDFTRMSWEMIFNTPRTISVTRQHAEIMATSGVANAERVNLSRMSYEILSRKGPNAVEPLPLAEGVDFFFHNWAEPPTLESGWLTDIQVGETGAEERRGLSQRPLRVLNLHWLVSERSEADRMLVALRKMTATRFQAPLYMDQAPLTAAALTGTTLLTMDPTRGRFFVGARVAIVRRSGAGGMTPSAVQYHQIATMTTATLTLADPLTADVQAGDLVFPMIDCDIVLSLDMQYVKAYGATVRLAVLEYAGPSQLPARISDFPDGFSRFQGKPIFNIEPDWINGVDVGVSRQGERSNAGRADLTFVEAERGRQTASYFFSAERDEALKIIDFFETRRGRLRTFWFTDPDQIWRGVATSTTFVDIDPFGDFDNFQEEFDFIGIVMKDGTIYVREVVTIQAVLGVWRITVDVDLPAISLSQIRRIVRARHMRFDGDSMTESWATDGLMTTRLGFLEALNEEEVEL